MFDCGVGLDNVAVSDGQCLMVAETLGRRLTVLLSSLMEGISCCFILFMDIQMMGRGFSLIEAGELGLGASEFGR